MDRMYRRVMEVFTIQFSRNDRHAIELARLLTQWRSTRDQQHANRFFFFALTLLVFQYVRVEKLSS